MSDDTIGTGQPGQDAFTPVEELSYCLLYTSDAADDQSTV